MDASSGGLDSTIEPQDGGSDSGVVADGGDGFDAGRSDSGLDASGPDDGFPESAELCDKCQTRAMIQMDGCMTCLSCGYSKCG